MLNVKLFAKLFSSFLIIYVSVFIFRYKCLLNLVWCHSEWNSSFCNIIVKSKHFFTSSICLHFNEKKKKTLEIESEDKFSSFYKHRKITKKKIQKILCVFIFWKLNVKWKTWHKFGDNFFSVWKRKKKDSACNNLSFLSILLRRIHD